MGYDMKIEDLVTTAKDQPRETFDWGEIIWIDNHELVRETALTVGKVTINPGEQNSKHSHPNCDEALYLLSGELTHTLDDEETTLTPGDLIHIPQGMNHQGINDGDDDAIAIIAYDTGTRQFKLADENKDSE